MYLAKYCKNIELLVKDDNDSPLLFDSNDIDQIIINYTSKKGGVSYLVRYQDKLYTFNKNAEQFTKVLTKDLVDPKYYPNPCFRFPMYKFVDQDYQDVCIELPYLKSCTLTIVNRKTGWCTITTRVEDNKNNKYYPIQLDMDSMNDMFEMWKKYHK